jgi:hypothetical protein
MKHRCTITIPPITIEWEDIESATNLVSYSNVYPINKRKRGKHKSHVWVADLHEHLQRTGGGWKRTRVVARQMGMSKQAVYNHAHRHPEFFEYEDGMVRAI